MLSEFLHTLQKQKVYFNQKLDSTGTSVAFVLHAPTGSSSGHKKVDYMYVIWSSTINHTEYNTK